MSENHRLPDCLEHIQQAATDARSFVEGLAKDDFLADKRTQRAVIMNLIIIGEAATKVMDGYAEFAQAHTDVPWRFMRGMRNRMAHGYFDINLDVVWETNKTMATSIARTTCCLAPSGQRGRPSRRRIGTMTSFICCNVKPWPRLDAIRSWRTRSAAREPGWRSPNSSSATLDASPR